jgi:hypothetical protein
MNGHANLKKSHCWAAVSVDARGYLMQFLRRYDYERNGWLSE